MSISFFVISSCGFLGGFVGGFGIGVGFFDVLFFNLFGFVMLGFVFVVLGVLMFCCIF